MSSRPQRAGTTPPTDLMSLANVGPAIARKLARLGITERSQLAGRDPIEMYDELAAIEGRWEDPCLLDTFMSAVEQAEGGPARPWWDYTSERKRLLGSHS